MENQEYLMISNPGVAPLEGFLLMGASDKDSQDANTIGMFGSGVKYSVAQLFRVGRPAVVGFREHPGQGGMCKGQYQAGKKQIQLNMELGGEDLEMTILEELAHHYSGQADYTRGFQEWLLRVVRKGVRGGGEGG